MAGGTADLLIQVRANVTQAETALAQVRTQLTGLDTAIGTGGAAPGLAKAEEGIKKVGAAAEAAGGKVGFLGEHFARMGEDALAFGAAFVGFEAVLGLVDGLKNAVVDFPEKIESARITFETFTGSAQVATDVVGQLEDLSRRIPFGFEAIASTAQRLIALGAPAEDVVSQVTDIAAAAASVNSGDAGMEKIAVALARIQETGLIDARVMRQLTTDQIPAWQILAQGMHKTIPELQLMMKHGEITADQFLVMFHEFESTKGGDALAAQANTITGSLTIAANAMDVMDSKALAPLTEHLTKAAQAFRDFANSDSGDKAAKGTASALTDIFTVLDAGTTRAEQDLTGLTIAMKQLNDAADASPLSKKHEPAAVATFGKGALPPISAQDATLGLAFLLPEVTAVALAVAGGDAIFQHFFATEKDVGAAAELAAAGVQRFNEQMGRLPGPTDTASGALRHTREELNLIKMGASDAATTIGTVSDELVILQRVQAEQAAAAAAANKHTDSSKLDTVDWTDPYAMGLNNYLADLGKTMNVVDAAEAAAKKAASSFGSVGQAALASIPGLAAFDVATFGLTQQLAGVQLGIEEKVLARMQRRPARTPAQLEKLLQEEIKVRGLERQVGFGGAINAQGQGILSSEIAKPTRASLSTAGHTTHNTVHVTIANPVVNDPSHVKAIATTAASAVVDALLGHATTPSNAASTSLAGSRKPT